SESCALFLAGRRLKQGSQGAVVATSGFWRPLPLTANVGGDSAVYYARRFERNDFRAGMVSASTGVLVLSGLLLTRPCRFHSDCGSGRFVTGGSMIISGTILGMFSKALHHDAERDATRALWWNNARYSRP